MKRTSSIALAAAAIVGTFALLAFSSTSSGPRVERIDFGKVVTPVMPAYDAALPPVSAAPVKDFRIPIEDRKIEIAGGVMYDGWTFGGTVPGPVLHVRQGDSVRITVVNETGMPHSIDLHAARIAPNVAYRTILAHDSLTFEFQANDPGAFLVHCGTSPMTMHIMQGMYMAMIVEPRDGWGTRADKEFVLVQSEFYARDGVASGMADQADWQAAMAKNATFVAFNGRAFQYRDHPLQVNEGDRVRLFVVNAGPSFNSDFHVVGAVFDRVLPDGNPRDALHGVQTYVVPAGGGAVFETVFAKGASGAGMYAFVTHSFVDAEKGAMGMIQVTSPTVVAQGH
ncbi:MAG TPA: multicopper oxidase domain-containing protein [Gemmatimonadaceae bacterium]|nr:multicopper oxidase domain-containing protein [Gemmatimonadaceae bacterium]